MALRPGTRFGPYVITDQIGVGGMGEVYRARDENLGRDVAIKVLPEIVAHDADRRARFEREAKTLASLDHPNIATIHGLEKSEGTHALVMELVEGPTLADCLAQGPLPVNEALLIAKQIAEALEAAHEQGIVHRDLKPANIKVRPDGTVKVLDFGLAKAMEPASALRASAGQALSQSPTITTPAMTQAGVILGTAAYMSTEQARGRVVDRRSDIWAFGCVLYEMLTGRRAFEGDSVSETLARVLEREPDWRALQPGVPASLTRVLQRCLEKDPKRRLHAIADARIEIEDVLSGSSRAPAETGLPDSRPAHRRWAIAMVASLVALVSLSGIAWNLWTRSRSETSPRVLRTTLTSPKATVSESSTLAITPDGTRLVYTGNEQTQLFVRRLDQLEPTAIFTGAAPLNWVFVSPDSEWLGFVEGGRVKKVALAGGPVTFVAQVGTGSLGVTWLPDNSIIFGEPTPATGLQRVSAAGGAVTVLTRPDPSRGEMDHAWPEALPGGRAVLYTITAATGGLDAAQIAVLDLATGASKIVARGGSHARYLPSGHLVYAVGRTLVAVPFDLDRLEVRGTPVQVLPRLAASGLGAGLFSVSVDGTLVYLDAPSAVGASAFTMVWVDRQGKEEPLAAPPRVYTSPRLSPDGKRVAVGIVGIGNDIFVWDLVRQTLMQLTLDPATDFFPAWMPDNRHLVFYSNRSGGAIFRQPADGAGAAEAISNGIAGVGMLPSSVTPDGSRVLFSQGGRDLMALVLDGSRRVDTLVQTPSNERNGIVSPNGRWLAYDSDSSGRFEIYVRPFPNVNTGQQWLISTAGGIKPLWAQNGRELFYVAPDGALMAVAVGSPDAAAWSAGSPAKVVAESYYTRGPGSARSYDVSSDGQRFLMLKPPPFDPATATQIVMVQGWFEELKRLVPSN